MKEQVPVRVVLFDFDGTLADSYPAITASVNYVRSVHGLEPISLAEVRRHVGRGAEVLVKETVDRGDVHANLALYKMHHPTVMLQGTHLFPGVADTLRKLHQRGLYLGVCSNKPVEFTRALLSHMEIADNFDQVLGPEDVRHPKPAPDMLLEGLKRLNVNAEEARYVGDMTVDIQTARAAGIKVWSVSTGSDDRETLIAARPDRLLQDLAEVALILSDS
jgi:phosphoglycolate phosphatase